MWCVVLPGLYWQAEMGSESGAQHQTPAVVKKVRFAEMCSESGDQHQTPAKVKKVRFTDTEISRKSEKPTGLRYVKRPMAERDEDFRRKTAKSKAECSHVTNEAARQAAESEKSAGKVAEQNKESEAQVASQQANTKDISGQV